MIKIYWQDKHVSLNILYSQVHWTKRKRQRDEWHNFFYLQLLQHKKPKQDTYKIQLKYNSRLDVSNTIIMIKYLEDVLVKKLKWFKDDSPKYCKAIIIQPDERMKKKSYMAKIY